MDILNIVGSLGALLFVAFFIGLCIFSHELGHFLAGRLCGLHIDAFSIGFCKIWSKKINGVEYRIGCIPLGGYVELPQVDSTDAIPKCADGTQLKRATPLCRIVTAAAGPLFNIVFGLLLGCIVWICGLPQESPKMRSMQVSSVITDSPEYRAGLRPGDRIIRLNGKKFNCTWMQFVEQIMFSVGKITLDVERNGGNIRVEYTPIDNPNAPGRLADEKIGYPFFSVLTPIELRPERGSIAERAGIIKGDILYAIDGQAVASFLDFQMILAYSGDRILHFQIDRDGKKLDIPVRPEPIQDIEQKSSYYIGVRFKDGSEPVVAGIMPRSPASDVELSPGDRILALNDVPVTNAEQVIRMVRENGARSIVLSVENGRESRTLVLVPRKVVQRSVGVELVLLSHPTPFEQFSGILNNSYKSLRGMLVGTANAIGLTEETSTLKPRHMSGPIGMGAILYNSVRKVSLTTGIYFVVMISFALAIFNLLPLPVLDGGHIVFAVIELCLNRPLPAAIVKGLSLTFVILLAMLMFYVTYFDILRLLPARKPQPDISMHSVPKTVAPAQQNH